MSTSPDESVAARLRSIGRTAYTATAGHLDVGSDEGARSHRRRRWAVLPRVAVAAIVVLALMATGLVIRSLAGAPDAVPVEEQRVTGAAGPGVVEIGAGADDATGPGGAALAVADPESVAGATDPSGESAGTDPSGESVAPVPSGAARPAVVVHVAGQVHEPGVVELAPGARVHDAVAAAGGARPEADLAAVNLARIVVDGEQVYVPTPGEAVPAAGAGSAGAAAPGAGGAGGPVNLNLATAAELDALPGIGPVLAQRIVDWRDRNGRFTVVEELAEVSGIGPAILGRLRDLVTV